MHSLQPNCSRMLRAAAFAPTLPAASRVSYVTKNNLRPFRGSVFFDTCVVLRFPPSYTPFYIISTSYHRVFLRFFLWAEHNALFIRAVPSRQLVLQVHTPSHIITHYTHTPSHIIPRLTFHPLMLPRYSDGMGKLAATLENPLFSTAPLQSFQYAPARSCVSHPAQFRKLFPLLTALKCVTNRSVTNDGVKGSWFAGIPKRVIVNGA